MHAKMEADDRVANQLSKSRVTTRFNAQSYRLAICNCSVTQTIFDRAVWSGLLSASDTRILLDDSQPYKPFMTRQANSAQNLFASLKSASRCLL